MVGNSLLAFSAYVYLKVADVVNHIDMQKPQRESVNDDFTEPIMEEQVRDNKAWYLLLFAVVDELVSHNLKETIRQFSLSFS